MKKIFLLTLVISCSLVFSACDFDQQSGLDQNSDQEASTGKQNSSTSQQRLKQDPSFTIDDIQDLSNQDDLDTIEKELEETIIFEEDFSDL